MAFYDCINHKNAKINQSKYVHKHKHTNNIAIREVIIFILRLLYKKNCIDGMNIPSAIEMAKCIHHVRIVVEL